MAPTVYTPPENTYIPIGSVTLSATASEVTFSSIPATYRDLIVVMGGTLSADSGINVRFNGDTLANYTRVFMFGNGSTDGSGAGTDPRFIEIGTGQSNFIMQIMDYSATDKHKTTLTRSNQANRLVWANAGRWANTAAITSVTLDPDAATLFSIGTTVSLYAIAG